MAGVAALVGAMMAKVTEKPATAADGDPLIIGNLNFSSGTTGLLRTSGSGNVLFDVFTNVQGVDAIHGASLVNGAGLVGTSHTGDGVVGVSKTHFGVRGGSAKEAGVHGTSESASGVLGEGRPGVQGKGAADDAGVVGVAGSDRGTGVRGESDGGTGVFGTVTTGTGVFGRAPLGIGIEGEGGKQGVLGQSGSGSGVEGTSLSSVGVRGFSNTGVGVRGTTGKPVIIFQNSDIGVHGLAPTGTGVRGDTSGGVGVHGKALNPAGKAALFEGAVVIDGSLTLNGQPVSAILSSDGSLMRLPSGERSERWIEDFGTGVLVDGVAGVTLESQFAAVLRDGREYHAFLTPEGDSSGLYVSAKGPTSFEVREHQGGTSSLRFSYRVIAMSSIPTRFRSEGTGHAIGNQRRVARSPDGVIRVFERAAAEPELASRRFRADPGSRRSAAVQEV